jgi:hypothetical protein
MAKKVKVVQFVLLPAHGLRVAAASQDTRGFFLSLSTAAAAVPLVPGFRVVDSIHEDGAKLVEMLPSGFSSLRARQPGARLAPLMYYRTARSAQVSVQDTPKKAPSAAKIVLKVIARKGGAPVAGAFVVAFTDFARRIGASATTNKKGEASLQLGAAKRTLDRLYVYPSTGYWSALRSRFQASSGAQVLLDVIDPGTPDVVRWFYGEAEDAAGTGVTVGVVDTGIGPHADLAVDGGANTVVGEDPADFADNGAQHGTHVGGIIASRGRAPGGVRGLAPGVRLRSYRVFGKKSESASNYSIAKALDAAVRDGCDLVNMSLGGGEPDDVLRAAVEDARAAGTVVIVAAGNDSHAPVSFPASDDMAVAVSAYGRKGTYPSGTTEAGDAAAPYGTDRSNFIAAFSNCGPEIDLAGPGVGVVSTVPGGLAVMSGTSMACPAVTGRAAALLAGHPEILGMPRTEARAAAMLRLLLQSTQVMGFGPIYEGQGRLK